MHVCFQHLLTAEGWRSPARVEIDRGVIVSISEAGAAPETGGAPAWVEGYALPALPNLHSHAFQRALVGRGQRRGETEDSFWTWRQAMYRLAGRMGPEELEVVATQLFVEMLEAGFAAVGEFHYLHHDVTGRPYADPAETSRRIVAAASRAGIALTLLPVLYMQGDFGVPPRPEQGRFVHDSAEAFLRLVEALRPEAAQSEGRLRLGIAPHSLRAVPPEAMREVASAAPDGPIHVHVAEQRREVEAAVSHLGARPVRYLLDHGFAGPEYCFVHATHLDEGERRDLAASGVVAGLCPTTEADLGDGLFPLVAYRAEGGRWGIGTDSHVSVCPAAELRLLEYGQRLRLERRNLVAPPGGSVGHTLLAEALRGGAQALAQPMGLPAPGVAADFVVLDPTHPRLLGHTQETVLDAWILGAAEGAVDRVMVGGRWVVTEGRHRLHGEAAEAFARVMDRLWRDA